MKRVLAMTLSLMMAAAMLSGCGSDDSSTNSTASSNDTAQSQAEGEETNDSAAEGENNSDPSLKAPVNDGAIDVSKGCTENMLTRSIFREGDTSRLAKALRKNIGSDKEVVNVVFLGDSITAGSSASNENQYVKQFTAWWEENISLFVEVSNVGIGATDSYLGVHRAQRDVLSKDPDIIFIEFINDSDNEFYKATMDSLVRMCLSAENMPAVVLIEMTMEDGTCPQNVHTQIAEAYDIPVISYHDAVLPEVEAGNIVWKDISPDNIHPNNEGHIMLGQMLTNFISQVLETAEDAPEPTAIDVEAPTGDKYSGARISDKSTGDITVVDEGTFTGVTSPWNFPDGWASNSGGEITFEMEFKNLGLLYYKRVDGFGGTAEVIVDGETVKTINSDFTGGWGDYGTNEEVYTSDEVAKHTVTVKVVDDDVQQYFEVLGWLIS